MNQYKSGSIAIHIISNNTSVIIEDGVWSGGGEIALKAQASHVGDIVVVWSHVAVLIVLPDTLLSFFLYLIIMIKEIASS